MRSLSPPLISNTRHCSGWRRKRARMRTWKSPWGTTSRRRRPRGTRCEPANESCRSEHSTAANPTRSRRMSWSLRRARQRQQSRDRVELSRAALARPVRGEADSRTGYRLAAMASHQACSSVRSARLFRVPPVPRVLQRHSGPVDDPRRGHGSLLAGRAAFRFRWWRMAAFTAWHDGRENPDTFQALLEYPKGFLVSYSTSFGNDSDSFTRVMGDRATLINIGGEGSQRWKMVEEHGHAREQSVRPPVARIYQAAPVGTGEDGIFPAAPAAAPSRRRTARCRSCRTAIPVTWRTGWNAFAAAVQPNATGGCWLFALRGGDHVRPGATRGQETLLGIPRQ